MMATLDFPQDTFYIKLILPVVQLLLLSTFVQASGSGRETDTDAIRTIPSGWFIFCRNELANRTTYLPS